MILYFLKRYWKLIALAITVSLIAGSMYFLYSQNISLNKSILEKDIALEASQRTVDTLKADRDRVDSINKENTLRKEIIASELEVSQREVNKLRKRLKEQNEKGSECYSVNIPAADNERLRRLSREE